ncbi:hypothetical protein EYB53_020545 [Candidatus Chloroploca sp. M-50]|uniref:Uncharacterized protein n=1 Tax=Candidatus Chloroploca mongolica TaxID=2528176 RepID=A0ABS4DFA4_9CHLR|nr:choice-of-anchor X domain-containing protein [Candidatus Chloroploca mongolica]MBP1468115.1 hypothetical protein [Candidatus Chloroploca mongolica]
MRTQLNAPRHWWRLLTMIFVIASVGWSAAPPVPAAQAEPWANSGAGLSYSANGQRYRFAAAAPGAAVTPQKLGQAAPVGSILARLLDGQNAFSSGVIMQVSIEPDGPQFTMRDDGQAGDLVANDGQFAVKLPGFAEARYHSLSVSASWPEGQRKEIDVAPASTIMA